MKPSATNAARPPRATPVPSGAGSGQPRERELRRITHRLSVPLQIADTTIDSITVVEPLVHQMIKADRDAAANPASHNQLAVLLAAISDLPDAAAASRLRVRDIAAVSQWMSGGVRAAIAADGLVPVNDGAAAAEADPFDISGALAVDTASDSMLADMASSHVFELLSPFDYDGRRYERLTAVEPTLEAMIQAARFKIASEQTAAMVAVITGESMPVVARMAWRDLARIEAWLGPFVAALAPRTGGS